MTPPSSSLCPSLGGKSGLSLSAWVTCSLWKCLAEEPSANYLGPHSSYFSAYLPSSRVLKKCKPKHTPRLSHVMLDFPQQWIIPVPSIYIGSEMPYNSFCLSALQAKKLRERGKGRRQSLKREHAFSDGMWVRCYRQFSLALVMQESVYNLAEQLVVGASLIQLLCFLFSHFHQAVSGLLLPSSYFLGLKHCLFWIPLEKKNSALALSGLLPGLLQGDAPTSSWRIGSKGKLPQRKKRWVALARTWSCLWEWLKAVAVEKQHYFYSITVTISLI